MALLVILQAHHLRRAMRGATAMPHQTLLVVVAAAVVQQGQTQ
jgi:hypothetical protein